MKKIILSLVVVLTALNGNGQVYESNRDFIKIDPLKKSKRQRTKGFILLGTGTALIATGAIAIQQSQDKGQTETLVVLGGLAATSASIPFFISARANKRKAAIMMRRSAILITPGHPNNITYTSLGIRLDI